MFTRLVLHMGYKAANCHQKNRFLVIFYITIQSGKKLSILLLPSPYREWRTSGVEHKFQSLINKTQSRSLNSSGNHEWHGLKKNKSRRTPTQKHETTFLAK